MDYDDSYVDYQNNRSRVRKAVRSLYLRAAAGQLVGPTLDIGCGLGDLLRLLPHGSAGLEYNKAAVERCNENGLPVSYYDGFKDDWRLGMFSERARFGSMVISHVLEHLDAPAEILRKLLVSAARLEIRRVLVIVPGKAGFNSDETHRTFVDLELLSHPEITRGLPFTLRNSRYFPFNFRRLGDWFTHHELQALYEVH
ncbi:methionine biosynthesis protein MetW [Pseudoxanthomonas winnipegensis]|jgi:hypothetical protein|uniref:Methyltransferase domain-containing protein n=1 Tax=Pseudoxanthomonas winnipegensis TaxID=2480810 RepID=A0A4Q8LFI1_9GAMM|nr:methionine biosynthesis protein MetW [Pseudoxanthomonas winnipegensis]TAA28160.1 hypothetical protein EA660_00740 [Pseudoxanthomonas winnipegensis]HCH0556635.1 hypothetical protein [Pseudomonas aeruginosa]